MVLLITSKLCAEMVREAQRAAPQECCGLLIGPAGSDNQIDAILPTANISDTPEISFVIDPAVLAEAQRNARNGGPQIIGYYHSHPNGRAEPSAEDAKQAAPDGRVWAIIANGAVRFWRAQAEHSDEAVVIFVPQGMG